MSARIGNLVSELVPTPASTNELHLSVSGTTFTKAQFSKLTSHVFCTFAGDTNMTFDGRDPDGDGVVPHAIAAGSTMTLPKRAFLAARFSGGPVVASQMCTG
jgi:hypothetical protein